jgi:hypothetical protein
MTKWLRILRCGLPAAALLFLSLSPARAQPIQLDVVTIAVIENGSGISLTLSAESRRAFADFSRKVAGASIEIRSAGEILAVVRLQTSIEGGVLQFPVREGNATEVARKISENARKLTINVEGIKRFGPRPNPFVPKPIPPDGVK